MPPEQVQTLNYCAHALHELEHNLHHVAPESVQVCRGLVDKLRQSVKFILPNGCHLIDPTGIPAGASGPAPPPLSLHGF
jgi:hypothetical protein